MENFGNRLKEERERLGLSQAKFALMCNIGKTAQFNYESNARIPDGTYLSNALELGVDVGYLLSGERTTPVNMYPLAASNVLSFVATKAGINTEALLWILDIVAHSESKAFGGTGSDLMIAQEEIIYLVDELFNSGDLLSSVILETENFLHSQSVELTPGKKYALIMMLYRSFKINGGINVQMIKDAVKFASS